MPWTKVFLSKEDLAQFSNRDGLRNITYAQALNEAQDQLLASDDRVYLIGEGIDDPKGIFGSTTDLQKKYGPDRVVDIPIAENGMTGVAIGSAIAGMRPIFIHMRVDFMAMCMDQIINHAAKWSYMTGGRVGVPIVIRALIGRGWGSAAQHSQALHALFNHIPGLKVIMPSSPYDAKGMLMAAVQDDNPVIMIEHRWIYQSIGFAPEEPYTVPLGQGVIRRPGDDVTVVAFSQMVYEAMKAARELEKEGVSMELLDPRSINPFDYDLLFESVAKTGRLVIADVACKTGGIGAEIGCRAAEKILHLLKAPIRRVNFADTPTPCSSFLEKLYYPSYNDIIDAVREVVNLNSNRKTV